VQHEQDPCNTCRSLRGRQIPWLPRAEKTAPAAKQAKLESPLTDSNRRPPPCHRAAASNGAPDGVEQVRKALFDLVEQVVDEPAYT
jgi:hypothetical protein